MNRRTTAKCQQVVAPLLAADERITLTEAAQIGKVSLKRRAAVAAGAAVATAGVLIVSVKPAGYFLVLTTKRLFILQNARGIVGPVLAAVGVDKISAEPLRAGLLTFHQQVAINGTPYHFSWGRAQPGMARTVASALTDLTSLPAAS